MINPIISVTIDTPGGWTYERRLFPAADRIGELAHPPAFPPIGAGRAGPASKPRCAKWSTLLPKGPAADSETPQVHPGMNVPSRRSAGKRTGEYLL